MTSEFSNLVKYLGGAVIGGWQPLQSTSEEHCSLVIAHWAFGPQKLEQLYLSLTRSTLWVFEGLLLSYVGNALGSNPSLKL